MGKKAWENRAAAHITKLTNSIPIQWRLTNIDQLAPTDMRNVTGVPQQCLTSEEYLITECSIAVLLENIHTGVWSAVEVTSAFCHRAAIAHQLVNCLTELLFDEALKNAQELDEMRSKTGHLKGPLHGLPVSFMDRYRIAGAETACGYVAWLGQLETPETESLMVQLMRNLGAIPFAKTNVPMSMLLGETDNNIVGTTSNPFVRHLTSGGAAGGEGALLAMGGSCMGWATEIAGSGRIPASFGNLYSLKPSIGRMPAKGFASSQPAMPICEATVSPLCRDLVSLKMLCKAVLGNLPIEQEPKLLDMPWRVNKYAKFDLTRISSKKPTFGIMFSDGHVRPHPPVLRALKTVVTSLRKAGYQVIPWSPPSHEPAIRMLFQILGADGLAGVRQALDESGEPPVAQLKDWYHQSEGGSMSVLEFWALCQKRVEYQIKYQEYWNTTGVDGVIMPVAPSACAEPNQMTYFGYTAIGNILDYSAGTFPMGFADRQLDSFVEMAKPLSADDKRIAESYDPRIFHGAPVGLQVMCRRLEEEKVIALLEVIQMAVATYGKQ